MTANTTGSLTTTSVNHLNMMNRAAQDVALGTRLKNLVMVTGSYTLTLADNVSNTITQFPGFTGQKGFIVQAYHSGSLMSGSSVITGLVTGFHAALSGSSLNVYTGSATSGSAFTTGDVLNYIIF